MIAATGRRPRPRPTTTEPATTEPATTEPATTEPATTEPATTEPATTDQRDATDNTAPTAFADQQDTTEAAPRTASTDPRDATEVTTSTAVTDQRDRDEVVTLLTAAARLFVTGTPIAWDAIVPAPDVESIPVAPTYPFQRERFWLAPSPAVGDASAFGLRPVTHPLLSAAVTVGEHLVLTGRLTAATTAWLGEHVIAGTPILPGTGFVDLAIHAGDQIGATTVGELTLHAPLTIPTDIQVQITPTGTDGHHDLTITSPTGLHATGTLTTDTRPETHPDLATWPPPGAEAVATDGLYDRLAAAGYRYGPVFQSLRAVWTDGDDVYAAVELPDGTDTTGYGIHPALLDAAFQATLLADEGGAVRSLLPFSFSDVRLHAVGANRLAVRLRPLSDSRFALTAVDQKGDLVVSVGEVATRPAAEVRTDAGGDALFTLNWSVVEAGEADGAQSDIDVVPVDVIDADPVVAARAAAGSALAAVQRLLAEEELGGGRLVLLTRGAVAAVAGEVVDPAAAAAWGLVRSAQSEHPGRFVLIDDDTPGGVNESVVRAAAATGESQLAIRGGQFLVPRLVAPNAPLPVPDGAWRLTATGSTLDELAFTPDGDAAAPLEPWQIRVAVRAAGVNFRDVLIALGMYPERAFLGTEGAGVVTETGSAVTHVNVGDRVMGFVDAAFGPLAVADARTVVRMPAGWSFAQAAAVPVVFATAWYGLRDLGGVTAGQRVLVHAAAGGVGMAAVQLARHLGAEVFATASPGKWPALRRLGLDDDHLASSRTLDFEEQFRAATGGAGMDLVLDSLAREFVDASLRLLPRGGRFVSMGKTDIRDPEQVAAAHPGVRYQAFDTSQAGPERIGEMLREVLALFERGDLSPLPVTAWDVRDAREALRHMSQARHIGKIVLTVPAPLNPAGTVLVTGGTGTLGAHVARHLVTVHGMRNLLLTSRRGSDSAGAGDLVHELRGLGAEVTVAACDVADRDAVAALLATIPSDRPLTAVVHTAGVVDDGTVEQQTPDRIDTVMRSKVDATVHLGELTDGDDLAAFVLFSSVAGLFGSAGQSNYAAANAFLDAFARQRAAHGLPARSLAWGFWSDRSAITGSLADTDVRRVARTGMAPLSTEAGLALLDAALAGTEPAVALTPLDRGALRSMPPENIPVLLRGLVQPAVRRRSAATDDAEASFAERFAAMSGKERHRELLDLVRRSAALVLGHADTGAVAPAESFKNLGFDSLTAVELRNHLHGVTGLRLPATVVFDHPSPEALAAAIDGRLAPPVEDHPAVLTELDRLEAALAGAEPEDDVRDRVTNRLQTLLRRWTDTYGTAAPEIDDDVLDTATDDDMFDLIDRELGRA
ncbi:SDR family NAD(P)-dependent oxidoreductase [Micromonospora sp. DT231]|uniref:SDR family NAD(P)-dependent oxidoreductase n=1 Tax=Micromonospora sp. DT231 TaxID=3416526 RepID=UPI003CF2E53E